MADLAFGEQVPQGARRLGSRHGRVGPVNLVQVDVVGTQRGQTGVHTSAEPFRTRVADQAGIGLAQPAFGGDNELVAVTGERVAQRPAEDAFGRAEPVCLRCVEEVDP